MTVELDALVVDALDPPRLRRFWAGALAQLPVGDALLLDGDTGLRLRFVPTDQPKVGQNRLHLDLTSTSLADQQRTVARALSLGGRHVDVGQLPEERHVVLADPEGNEFCVIEPGNAFLADCGFVGALACDGSHGVGYFWSHATGWPLVWDRDEETAIRSPRGGPKVSWGGPPYAPVTGRNRLHLDVAPPGALGAEVDRLVSLGATRAGVAACAPDAVAMTDPDGNGFCLLAASEGSRLSHG